MSDSTPRPKPAEAAATARPPWRPGFWTASLAFHGLLFVWLFWFSPVRWIERSPEKTGAARVGAEQARRVIEKIRAEQAVPLSESVRSLQNIRRQLVELESAKKTEFQSLARERDKDAPPKAAQALARAAEAQAKASSLLERVGPAFDPWIRTRAAVPFDEMMDTQKEAREAQTEAIRMQEQVESILSLGDARFSTAWRAQEQATRLQDQARQAVVAAEEALEKARGAHEMSKLEHEIDHNTYWVRHHRRSLEEAPQRLADAAEAIQSAETAATAARTDLEKAQERAQARPGDDTRQMLWTALETEKKARKDLDSANRKYAGTAKSLEDDWKELPALRAKVEALMARLDPTPPVLTEPEDAVRELQRDSVSAQAAATRAQDEARAAFEAALARPAEGRSLAAATAPLPPPPADQDPTGLNLADLYRTALETESSLTESYRQIRATELAMIRQLPLSRAVELTEVTKALRPDLSAALARAVASGPDAVAARESIQAARAEIAAMLQLGNSLLAQARGLNRGDGSTISIETYRSISEQAARMEAMATEMEGKTFADMTGDASGGEWPGGAGEGDGSGWPGGAGRGGPGAGVPGGLGGPGSGNGGGGSGPGGGPGAVSWFAGGGAAGMAAGSGTVTGFPARRIASNGTGPDWCYIDSWYVIGPFDNSRRANVEKKFPPETTVDLNATYPGKNNVPVRWEFQQSGTVNIMPRLSDYNARVRDPALDAEHNYRNNLQYIIYYACTELNFEEDCDLLVSVGSDDFSKLWINDRLVWVSGKNLKAWKINEGCRRVHFRKGINRVLYRIENGNDRTEFSLVLVLKT